MPPNTSSTSQGPSAQDWEDIREVFTQLYEGRTLKDVERILRLEYGFRATDRMYKKRIKDWGLHKNCKAKDMLLASMMVESREAIRKDSIITVGGNFFNSTKMDRYFRRVRSSKLIQQSMTSIASVTCSTPAPAESQRAALETESSQFQTGSTSTLSPKPDIVRLSRLSPTRSSSEIIALRSRRPTSAFLMSSGGPDASKFTVEDGGDPTRSHNIAKASDSSAHQNFRDNSIDLFRLMCVSPSQAYLGLQLSELSITQQIYLEIAAYFDMFFKSNIWNLYHSEQFHCHAMDIPELSKQCSTTSTT
jgi:hypothetical protein